METLRFDFNKKSGKFKVLNAVNNGPCGKRFSDDQKRDNFATYRAARFQYARNHDAAYFSDYGNEHTVDISALFPDFNADPNDSASYDFAVTDEYTLTILDADTKVFFRLGQRIEHYIKKYNIHPPRDFQKWAVICEHIIRHYNEGWADGFRLNIEYWEIWNEPDLAEDQDDKKTWTGTREQFFDFYEVAAKHLKKCFPHLKIGGPALAFNEEWAEEFLAEMHKRQVELDFFSWHIYCNEPEDMVQKAQRLKAMLVKNGYEQSESIINEWNYIRGWTDDYIYSIETIIGMKGAAFTMACMAAAQGTSIDMLMYYDARPSCLNGLFDFYTYRPLKGYYPFLWYGNFYDLEAEVKCETTIPGIYPLCGCDKDGKALAVVTYYTDKDDQPEKTFSVDFGKAGTYELYLLDDHHDGEMVAVTDELMVTMSPNSCVMIKEK